MDKRNVDFLKASLSFNLYNISGLSTGPLAVARWQNIHLIILRLRVRIQLPTPLEPGERKCIADMRLVVRSKCHYENNRNTAASTWNETVIFIINLAYWFAYFRYMLTINGWSLYWHYIFLTQRSTSHTLSLCLSASKLSFPFFLLNIKTHGTSLQIIIVWDILIWITLFMFHLEVCTQ